MKKRFLHEVAETNKLELLKGARGEKVYWGSGTISSAAEQGNWNGKVLRCK